MSQVEEFHSHQVDIDGKQVSVIIPFAVYECDDECCHVDRKTIERLAEWPNLDEHIARYEAKVTEAMSTLSRLRAAVALKAKTSGDCPCGYRAGSRPTQIGCGKIACPFARESDQ